MGPPGSRRKGRPQNSWMQQVTWMREGNNRGDQQGRMENKNKTLGTEKCETLVLFTLM